MSRPLYDPKKGKMRVAGLVSGSGKSLLAIIEKQKQLEASSDCNFEVVGLFSDNPNSKAEEIGTSYKLPFFINDIKAFYRNKGANIKNLEIRRKFDQQTVSFLKSLNPDVVVYAGYVWATTEPLVTEFLGINCHPADLRIERDGRRVYAGANGVRDALLAGESKLHSTLHLVTNEIDHGPILLLSEPIMVEDPDKMNLNEKSRYYLKLLNKKIRKLFAIGIDEISRGRFEMETEGNLSYNEVSIHKGFQL